MHGMLDFILYGLVYKFVVCEFKFCWAPPGGYRMLSEFFGGNRLVVDLEILDQLFI